jgi:hypothetical protein
VSPASNFITATIIFIMCIPFAVEYVIHGRFHRIAFLRTERVTSRIISESRDVVASLYHYAVRSRAERKRDRNNRTLKTWVFLLWSVIFVAFVTLVSFTANMSSVLFAVMIVWRNISTAISDTFIEITNACISAITSLVDFEPVYAVLEAFVWVLDIISSFSLNIDAIDVTCEGAQAPLELMLNLFLLGVTIIVIESNVQIFRTITFNAMTDKFVECFTQPTYRTWSVREQGRHPVATWGGWRGYALTGCLTVAVKAFGAFDAVQSFLQYIMSLVSISNFFPVHSFSENCNAVADYEGYDETLANLTSIFAWFLLFPALYEASKVLVPGLPQDMESVESVAQKRDPKQTLMHYLKVLVAPIAPDIWLMQLAAQWKRVILKNTPMETGSNTDTLLEQQKKLRDKRHARTVELKGVKSNEIEHFDSSSMKHVGGEKAVELVSSKSKKSVVDEEVGVSVRDTLEMQSDEKGYLQHTGNMVIGAVEGGAVNTNPRYRVISTGTMAKSKDDEPSGLYEARAGYSVDVWSHITLPIMNTEVNDIFVLCRIDRDDGALLLQQAYDIEGDGKRCDGRGATALAHDLNASNENHLVVVFTVGDHQNLACEKTGLPEAVARCGGTMEHFIIGDHFDDHGAYMMVGVPGSEESAGFEAFADSGIHAVIEAQFELTSTGFKMVELHVDEVEDYCFISSQSYLLSSIAERTTKENVLWKERQRLALPTMWTLYRLEKAELYETFERWCGCGCPFAFAPLVYFLIVFQFGHFVTGVGLRAWYLVLWKFFTFVQVCLGIWNESATRGFHVHEHIRNASVCWDKPILRLTEDEYIEYRKEIARKSGMKRIEAHTARELSKSQKAKEQYMEKETKNEAEGGEKNSKASVEKAYEKVEAPPAEDDNDPNIVIIDGKTYHLPVESEEQTMLQQEELKRHLRMDYSAMLHCLVACRSTLLILVPGLAMLSIFAGVMAPVPMFVYDERLEKNLPEIFIAHPFEEARAQEQERIEEQEHVRQTEISINDHDVDNPVKEFNPRTNEWQDVPAEIRAEIGAANEVSQANLLLILDQSPRIVNEWMVFIQGLTLMITESRGCIFLINLYKFILILGITLGDPDNVRIWMMSACIILIPYGLVSGMTATIILGRAMDITDGDIHSAFSFCGCTLVPDFLRLFGLNLRTAEEEMLAEHAAAEEYMELKNKNEKDDGEVVAMQPSCPLSTTDVAIDEADSSEREEVWKESEPLMSEESTRDAKEESKKENDAAASAAASADGSKEEPKKEEEEEEEEEDTPVATGKSGKKNDKNK